MTAAPAIERHSPGTFCWVELGTTDPAAAKAFYTRLFGWTFEDSPMGPDEVYTMWKLHGKDLGAMYKLSEDLQKQGVPPNWMLYVCVTDAAQTAEKAKANGATLMMEPLDVMDYGRMAVIRDPQGGVISVWEPKRHIGARIINTIGTLCWAELATKDTAKAATFYTNLFDWKTDTKKAGPPGMQTDYTEWVVGGAHIGGMLQMTEEWGDAPPNWMPYFQVTDCLETVEKVKKLGGKVEFGPLPIENVGHFALIADPQGAYFSVVEMSLVA
jgi:predicted enzyme related to lactoylglutathione lyase